MLFNLVGKKMKKDARNSIRKSAQERLNLRHEPAGQQITPSQELRTSRQ